MSAEIKTVPRSGQLDMGQSSQVSLVLVTVCQHVRYITWQHNQYISLCITRWATADPSALLNEMLRLRIVLWMLKRTICKKKSHGEPLEEEDELS